MNNSLTRTLSEEDIIERTAAYVPNRLDVMVARHDALATVLGGPSDREQWMQQAREQVVVPPMELPLPLVAPTLDTRQLAIDADLATDLYQAELMTAEVEAEDERIAAEPTVRLSPAAFVQDLLTPPPTIVAAPPNTVLSAAAATLTLPPAVVTTSVPTPPADLVSSVSRQAPAKPNPNSLPPSPLPPSPPIREHLWPALQGVWRDLNGFRTLSAKTWGGKLHMTFIRHGRGRTLLTLLLALLVAATLIYCLNKSLS
jgi:hypothetical protein